MGLREQLITHVFAGNNDPFSTIITQVDSATSPNGVTTAPQGTFLIIDYDGDNSDKDVYINTDGSTAWTQIHNDV